MDGEGVLSSVKNGVFLLVLLGMSLLFIWGVLLYFLFLQVFVFCVHVCVGSY